MDTEVVFRMHLLRDQTHLTYPSEEISAPQRRHLKGRQLATTATPRWRDPQGNILVRSTEHQDAFV